MIIEFYSQITLNLETGLKFLRALLKQMPMIMKIMTGRRLLKKKMILE